MDAPSPLRFTPADVMAAFSRDLGSEMIDFAPLRTGSIRHRPAPEVGAAIRRTLAAPLSFARIWMRPTLLQTDESRSTEAGAGAGKLEFPLRSFASTSSGERGCLLSHYALPSS